MIRTVPPPTGHPSNWTEFNFEFNNSHKLASLLQVNTHHHSTQIGK